MIPKVISNEDMSMPFKSLSAAAFAALLTTQAGWAAPDFVTDPNLCQLELMDRQERGMSFDGQFFSEIEYYCEIDVALPALDWRADQTFIKPGFCEEPGALFPTVFVFRTFQSEPERLYVYQGETGTPVIYHLCRE